MNRAVVSIGSNIDPRQNVSKALTILGERFSVEAVSNFAFTSPVGFLDQPDFLNGAVLLATDLSCEELKGVLEGIEKEMGRVKSANKFGPRVIDLDIVVWNGEVTDEDYYSREFLRDAVEEVIEGKKRDS